MRCLYLAEHLKGAVLFLINNNPILSEKIKEFGHDCRIISSLTDNDFAVMVEGLSSYPKPFNKIQPSEAAELKEMKEILRQEKIDVLITDLLSPSDTYLRALKETGVLLVSIDELSQATFPSDVVFNCNAVAPSRHYKTGDQTKVFMGQQYALLNRQFEDVEKMEVRPTVQKILVTCGGTDMKGLSLKVLQALKVFTKEIKIILIQGIDFKFQKELDLLLKDMKEVEVLKNVKNMSSLMSSVDIAIASGGTTMYELAFLGVPAVILNQYGHQNEFATTLAAQNVLINLGLGEKTTPQAIETGVTELLSFKKRKEMSAAAKKAIDGQGAMRVAQIIQEMAA